MAVLLLHRKARLDYEILKTFEAGLELFGFEVKSIRAGRGSLPGGYVIIRGGEAYLTGISIPPYQEGNTPRSYEVDRTRKLLLTKKEIGELAGFEGKRGLTIIPISVYNKNRKLKCEIVVVRKKKKYDKRETLKKKEARRDMDRAQKRVR